MRLFLRFNMRQRRAKGRRLMYKVTKIRLELLSLDHVGSAPNANCCQRAPYHSVPTLTFAKLCLLYSFAFFKTSLKLCNRARGT
jgi:hypothetical protein